jgi:uncharacterized heparinase superfamily protein
MMTSNTSARRDTRLAHVLRYVRTLQHLRPGQIAGLAWHRLHRPRPDLRGAPTRRRVAQPYQAPVAGAVALLAAERFRFLNVEGVCADFGDWQRAGTDKLWLYNLHYFDDLNAQSAEARRAWHERLLERWVRENPPAAGVGWDPFPVARRIVNWVKWSLRGGQLSAAATASLATQARWLRRRLEYHLLGNHLLVNAKALVHAGLWFEGPEAQEWYGLGNAILQRELREQILPDGGHCELSPMYHALVLEDLLDLTNVLRAYERVPPPQWLSIIPRMQRWLRVMTHPDGEIAFFNDAAFGIAPTCAALDAYALRLGLPGYQDPDTALTVLEASGYVRADLGGACMLCDCAPIGADHQPAHAHADTLSFELSLGGRRLFVNSGTSRYTWDADRQWQRGTAAHNTVCVDGTDSSEVWAAFRVARRAHAVLLAAATEQGAVLVAGGHDGYERLLPGRVHHSRRWRLDARTLSVEDQLSGAFRGATARFYLHPEVQVRRSSAQEVELQRSDGMRLRMGFVGASEVEIVPSQWYPRFGEAVANSCVAVHFAGATLTTQVSWA